MGFPSEAKVDIISEIIKSQPDGWFKLLTLEEGKFYNAPVSPEGVDLALNLKSQVGLSLPIQLQGVCVCV